MSNLVTVTIDGKTIQVPQGMNLVEAAKRAGVEIPVFCYHPKLDPAGVCRMCLEQIEKIPKPVTACTTPCTDGMVVHTQSETVCIVRKGVLEFTLLNHPLDCPVCDKGGECDLQDLTFNYGAASSRLQDGKLHKHKAEQLGPFIVLDEERCILCRRCTRFDDQVAQEKNLVIKERGVHNVVGTSGDQPYDSYFSGNTTDICPVGALTSDVYRFKARPWDLNRVPGVCTGCSVGCTLEQHYRFGKLLRLVGREVPGVNDGWLCDRGRFNHSFVDGESRIEAPLVKRAGQFVEVTWEEALQEIASHFRAAVAKNPASVGVIGGGRLTMEEAYLLQKLARFTLGTGNIDHRVSGQLLASHADYAATTADIDDATLILVADALPAEQAPVLDLRIRKASERGQAKVVTVGSTLLHYRSRSKTVGVKPGETAGVITDPDFVSRVAGEAKVVVVWDGRNAATGQALLQVLAAVRKQGGSAHLLVVGEQNNSRGAEYMGVAPDVLPGLALQNDAAARQQLAHIWGKEVPQAGHDTKAMLAAAARGELSALYLVSANLVNTYPDGSLVKEALSRVPFLVVQDLFLTETAKMAHVVLPAAAFTAKAGAYATLDGRVFRNQAAMAPEWHIRSDAAIFTAVAAVMGSELLTAAGLEAELQQLQLVTADAVLPGLPMQLAEIRLAVSVAEPAAVPADASGLVVVPVDRLYAGGGTAFFCTSMARVRPEAAAYMHPVDGAALGIAEGERVTLSSRGASVEFTVRFRPMVVQGTVQLVSGLPEAPANMWTAGTLVGVVAQQQAREVV